MAGDRLKDEAGAPSTYEAGKERLWAVEYTRGGRVLGIEIDLMEWQLKRRFALWS